MFKDSTSSYGWFSILLHWVSALLVFGLVALGVYMVDLDYYDPWYHKAPWWHISFGLLLLFIMLVRVSWRLISRKPHPLPEHTRATRVFSGLVKYLFYLLIFSVIATGYLITTADGKSASFFDWVSIPASLRLDAQGVDLAGDIHELLAWTIVFFAVLHAVAALVHHFVMRDHTLLRMLKPLKKSVDHQPTPSSQESHHE